MLKYLLTTILFVSTSVLLFLGFVFVFLSYPSLERAGTVEIRIEPGEPFSSVVHKLKTEGVIPNERLFSLWARLSSKDRKIQGGLYRFELPLPPRDVLNRMVLGRVVLHKMTIPEGLTIRETADLLDDAQVTDKERFLAATASPELLSLFEIEAGSIEGYLFPDTYYFAAPLNEEDLLMTMVQRFQEVFNSTMKRRAAAIGLSLHEVVTLASMIEKETRLDAERPLVSAVFQNRLEKRMLLQSDPTVIYGLKNFTGNLARKDLQRRTPYNTYRIQGLPPGPICNPGLPSLRAALYPASVPYLYFVSKNDGSHLFSVTLDEHNRAVNKYQRGR
jgi:UPF0755 protein